MLDYTKFTTEDLSSIDNKNSEIIPWKINEILEDKYSVFWKNLTYEEKDMIDFWTPEFREKMVNAKLKYNESTIECEIDWEKIVFDKIQPIQDYLSWEESMERIEELDWRKGVNETLMKKLVIIFKWNSEVLWLLPDTFYWTSTNHFFTDASAYCGNISEGYINYSPTNSATLSLCIHDLNKLVK